MNEWKELGKRVLNLGGAIITTGFMSFIDHAIYVTIRTESEITYSNKDSLRRKILSVVIIKKSYKQHDVSARIHFGQNVMNSYTR
jgi:hypothetical protein